MMELCEREGDGLKVTLSYDETFGCEVTVTDERTESGYTLRPIDPQDGKTAMDMFRHPYAYQPTGTIELVPAIS